MIETSRDSKRPSRAAALLACLVAGLATVSAGAVWAQNHFSVVALPLVSTMGFWAKVLLAFTLCAAGAWWLRRMTRPRG